MDVEVIRWHLDAPDFNEHGIVMPNEGAMRQAAWDAAAKCKPTFILLGDTDELPTPDVVDWIASDPNPAVDCWYADWVNLWGDERHAIGGTSSPWSFQNPKTNKKGFAVRVRDRAYKYRDACQHVRMEPNPLQECRTIHDDTHKLGPVKLIHHKYISEQWQRHPASMLERFTKMADGAEIVDVPMEWHWLVIR